MPHRISALQTSLTHMGEFFVLSCSAIVATINGLIDQESWDRLTGRHGALFVMAIALIVFWNSNRLREKRDANRQAAIEAREDERRKGEEEARQHENEARDARHKEAMELQRENAEKLLEISVENIKAQAIIAKALDGLTSEIRKCPKTDLK